MRLHATAVARATSAGWRAALLRGPSSAGKSDLALRLIGQGWRLVGDDYIEAWRSGGRLYVSASEPIAGLMEVRHLGVLGQPPLPSARAVLLVDCVRDAERLPEPAREAVEGVALPRLELVALEPSAPAKVELALARLPA